MNDSFAQELLLEKRKKDAICNGTFEGELDGRKLPGTIFDGTDAACPAWFRGCDYGYEKAIEKLKKFLVDSGSSKQLYYDCTGHGADHCFHCAILKMVQDLEKRKGKKP
ncbi:hypothetical protein LCGC14_0549780 [marine sediment metagenome]|uniref:Uncharacterized protein n=1 Tax=marine sediment metagenome TaxID=412755 RepID=A0A0F9UBP4_9ZZZZ